MSLITNINNIYKNGVIGNVRKAQEDSHDMKLKTPNGDVFVVCDGMGGHVGGAKASSLAVESILVFLNKEKYANPIEALNGALQFANMQILGFANEYPEYKGMGTTACILLLQGDEAWIAHVGDSRIYLYLGKEKELHRITKDHSYVQTLVDSGQITDEQAEHHPNKNRILKALGVSPNLEPTFNYGNKPIFPKNGDIFLICSDGLSGMIPDKTIERVLAQKDITLEKKGEQLINLAMEGETVKPGGQDNCTVELIKVDNSPWEKSEFNSYNPRKEKYSITGGFNSGKKQSSSKLIAAAIALIFVLGICGWLIWHRIEIRQLQKEKEELDLQLKQKVMDTSATWNEYYVADTTLKYYKNKEIPVAKSIENQTKAVEKTKASHNIKVKEYKDVKEQLDEVNNKINKFKK